jgi:transposase
LVKLQQCQKTEERGNLEMDIRMSKLELDQIVIIDSTIKGKITQKKAAEILGLSQRQVQRKIQSYRLKGPEGLAHKNRGRPSNRQIDQSIYAAILELINSKYKNFGPTLIAEKLEEDGIKIDHETLRRFMIKIGLLRTKKRKLIKHVYRERKHHFGELTQGDGSEHKWFNDEYSTLLALIDDATSIVELRFAPSENLEDFTKLTESYLKKHGRPRALYTDRGSVFKVNKSNEENQKKTQYSRMLEELNISIIYAHSPQAKGRVERLFKTLQDRLVKELKLNNIDNIEDANRFLEQNYLAKHNAKFSKKAVNNFDLHRSIDGYDLNSIFCIKENRILNNDLTISYKNQLFAMERKPLLRFYKSSVITVNQHFDGTIFLTLNDQRLAFKKIDKRRPKEAKPKNKIDLRTIGIKPKPNHPWKMWSSNDISKELKK